MPRINGNNSSNEGGNNGKSRSVAKSMKGIKLARRLPHKNKSVDATLSSRPGFFGGARSATTITSTGSQTYTVPKGVDTLTIEMVGGGGGGGPHQTGRSTVSGGGGGSGAKIVITISEVKSGSTLTFNIGAGGAIGSETPTTDGADGANTTFTHGGVTYTAGGGEGGRNANLTFGTVKDGSGGVATRGSGSEGTLTNGNQGDAKGLDGTPGASVASTGSYGVGGAGQDSSVATAGSAGFVKIT